MRADFLLQIANVLEKTAHVLDANDAEKQAAVKTARDRSVKELSVKFRDATGDDLPEDVLQKLAASDEDVLSTVTKLVEKSGSAVEALGSSSEKTGGAVPQTKAERAQAAYDSFGHFINS
jgi:hypothetical protein